MIYNKSKLINNYKNMGRPKLENSMSERILIRMTPKLKLQLLKYAKSKNELVSTSARNAIKQYITEEKEIEKLKLK